MMTRKTRVTRLDCFHIWTVSVALLACVTLPGCASTKVTSIRDATIPSRDCKMLLVLVEAPDLALRKSLELVFTSELRRSGVSAQASVDVVPPTRVYSNSETSAALNKAGCDSLLVVKLTSSFNDFQYVPATYSSNAFAVATGDTVSVTGSTRQVSGGYYDKLPREAHDVSLLYLPDGACPWRASTLTSGNSSAGDETMYRSLAKEVVKQLIQEGLLGHKGSA